MLIRRKSSGKVLFGVMRLKWSYLGWNKLNAYEGILALDS